MNFIHIKSYVLYVVSCESLLFLAKYNCIIVSEVGLKCLDDRRGCVTFLDKERFRDHKKCAR